MKQSPKNSLQVLRPTPEPADAARARGEALTAAIIADLATLSQTFWQIGEALHEMTDRKLYAKLGYETFPAYVEGALGVALSQAYKMIRVIRNYVRADAEKIGVERAACLIRYAKHLGVDPGELVRADAVIGGKPLSELSVRAINDAAAAAFKTKKVARSRAPAARRVAAENRAIAEGLGVLLADAKIRGARVSVAKGDIVIRLDRAALARRFAP